ncbi:LapD/MoxY N-terminal periplasmic domain-containing protein [Sulfurimonas sp.]|uniref:bifunctional diguanylate cyclase/phosphodiesterase n=1 Tax=Sulfurimonas sp. TaxID=2022749 RepID=UPI003D12A9DA
MTLFKQLALAIALIIVIILGSVLAINYQSSKVQMVESMYETTVNNISTLSQQLSNANDDKTLITSIIDAEFSSGYYQQISYKSYNSDFKYTQQYQEKIEGVPQWFIDFTNLEVQSVKSEVTTGWSILGEVQVTGDNATIYQSLYKIFTKLVMLFILFVTIALVVLYIMLHFILKPLKKIQHQAEAIMRNEFIIEKSIPFTTEFKEVSGVINSMVKKVEEMFNQANEAAKRNHKLMYQDPITKLTNKRYLLLKLPETLQIESKTDGGSFMLIALTDAEVLNQKLGREIADKFFLKMAEMLKQNASFCDESITTRMSGTEFSITLPTIDANEAALIAQNIYKDFVTLLDTYALKPQNVNINIGIYRYKQNIGISELLSRTDQALSQAKANEQIQVYVSQENLQETKTKNEWRSILQEALDNFNFKLKAWDCIDLDTKQINHKVMTFMIENENEKCFYGDFIAPAIDLGFSTKIYMHILETLFTNDDQDHMPYTYSIRLSNEFLKDASSFIYMENLFKKYAKKSKSKLIFEISNSFCANHTLIANGYTTLFRNYGFELCINSYTSEFSDLTYLKTLNPKMLKADISFLLDLTPESINSLHTIASSLDIDLIATTVKTTEQLKKLQEIQIRTVQGPITEAL